jgi:hypothetical protein
MEEHGRAFQLLASALEDVVVRLLGWQLHIACVSDFTGSWGAVRHVSSICDAQRWNWLREGKEGEILGVE